MGYTLNRARIINVYFRLNTRPTFARELPPESLEEQCERSKQRADSVPLITSVKDCSLSKFLENIFDSEYSLVGLTYREREDSGGVKFYLTCFSFVKINMANNQLTWFQKGNKTLSDARLDFFFANTWSVEVFSNPFYENGVQVFGERAICVSCNSRSPLYEKDGQPIMCKPRDSEGKIVEGKKVPREPKNVLRVRFGEIDVRENS